MFKVMLYSILIIQTYSITFLNAQSALKFAVIGDYGADTQAEEDVADLVKSWNPEFILTIGDNNYEDGAASTIDENIGQYYHEFIFPYFGTYGGGSPDSNRFFPIPGNHDWSAPNLTPYLNYFTLPHNERYYDFVWGNVHFFMIDADTREPDGYSETSDQAMWIKSKMESSLAEWKIAVLHFSPYCSGGDHGSISTVQWPYKEWGADAVFSGHDHIYERLIVDDLSYWVNGLGGKNIDSLDNPIPASQVLYNDDYGAMLCEVYDDSLTVKFITRTGLQIDYFSIPSTVTSNDYTGLDETPVNFSLGQNYPNPFNPSTTISYTIPYTTLVSIKVYDSIGNLVTELVNDERESGIYREEFNINNLSSGVYFYKLEAGNFIDTKKMVILK